MKGEYVLIYHDLEGEKCDMIGWDAETTLKNYELFKKQGWFEYRDFCSHKIIRMSPSLCLLAEIKDEEVNLSNLILNNFKRTYLDVTPQELIKRFESRRHYAHLRHNPR